MDYLWQLLISAVVFSFSVLLTYYIYIVVKGYRECYSAKEDELPCPSTCAPGYECKPAELEGSFVIGDVVEEAVEEDAEEAVAEEAVAEEAVAEAAPAVEEASI
jgi:hypothetical protein